MAIDKDDWIVQQLFNGGWKFRKQFYEENDAKRYADKLASQDEPCRVIDFEGCITYRTDTAEALRWIRNTQRMGGPNNGD